MAEPRYCEDCEEEVPGRRFRCPNCNQLVCGWCWNHVHALPSTHSPAPEGEPFRLSVDLSGFLPLLAAQVVAQPQPEKPTP